MLAVLTAGRAHRCSRRPRPTTSTACAGTSSTTSLAPRSATSPPPSARSSGAGSVRRLRPTPSHREAETPPERPSGRPPVTGATPAAGGGPNSFATLISMAKRSGSTTADRPGPRVGAEGSGPDDVAEIASRMRLATARLHRTLRQQSDTGLTPSQLSALAAIDRHGSLTLGELGPARERVPADRHRRGRQARGRRPVTRQPDPDDRRVVRVVATDDGREVVARIRSARTPGCRSGSPSSRPRTRTASPRPRRPRTARREAAPVTATASGPPPTPLRPPLRAGCVASPARPSARSAPATSASSSAAS